MYKTIINVPQTRDLETALTLFYSRTELSTADILEIFGCSVSTAGKLKRRAKEEMELTETQAWNPHFVNTRCAFRSWGLDVPEMEGKLKKIQKLRLNEQEEDAK